MPTYTYQVVTDDDSGEIFEVFQPMSDPPLKSHPETGEPVRRIPSVPNINTQWNEKGGKLSNKNLDRLGFTKYEKAGDGVYEKKAGDGPDTIQR
ncbi:MAG: zinc ribbon domain-containing protein [Phycisphaerales bacterium]|nr:zinc ribbon domain-containing protein [Phycisphaerales bacterium]